MTRWYQATCLVVLFCGNVEFTSMVSGIAQDLRIFFIAGIEFDKACCEQPEFF